MDEALKKALEELRGLIKSGDVEARTRLDVIEKAATERTSDVKTLRGELDQLKKDATERETTIRELQQKQRNSLIAADPTHSRVEALRMFGIMCRRALANYLRVDVPAAFRAEADQLKEYGQRMASMGRATLEVGTGSGTIFVPTILMAEMLIDTLEEIQRTVSMADFLPGLPKSCTIPTLTGRPTLQPKRASSDTSMTQADPTFSSVSINCEEAYIFFPVDNYLLEVAPAVLGNMMLPLLRDSILNGIDNWLWNADGTATYNSNTGVLLDTTYATILPAGKTAFADVTFQNIRALFAATIGRGRARGSFFMSDSVLGIFDDIEREGKRPLVVYPGDGATPRVLGKEVVIDEFFPTIADSGISKAFAAFGDLKTMLVALAGDGIQIAASSEYLFGKAQTAFRGTCLIDIVRKPVNTLRVLRTPAA